MGAYVTTHPFMLTMIREDNRQWKVQMAREKVEAKTERKKIAEAITRFEQDGGKIIHLDSKGKPIPDAKEVSAVKNLKLCGRFECEKDAIVKKGTYKDSEGEVYVDSEYLGDCLEHIRDMMSQDARFFP